MSRDSEDQCLPLQQNEIIGEVFKKSKITYSRKFLLSLSDLKVCKELPSRVDQSILSELNDTFNNVAERPRIPGSFSSQSFRRNEYGSSPPTRGDSGSYSRGVYGKWDTRSSGSNDKDGDSQSDLDSDSGKLGGNQSRRSRENEHDGLLGSGVLPRPSGHAAEVSAPKVGGNSQYQLNRSDGPYQPPRPYKAVPHTRRDTDSFNDETFGSSECSSQDRAEDERKRRASFELFRKENTKSLQEKPKQLSYMHKEKLDPDMAALLANSEDDKKLLEKNYRLEDVAPAASQSVSARCLPHTQTPASRPLVPPGFVPPGFANTVLEKNFGAKTLTVDPVSEVASVQNKDTIVDTKVNFVENGIFENPEKKIYETVGNPFTDVTEKMRIILSGVEAGGSVGVVNPSSKAYNLSDTYEGAGEDVVTVLDAEKVNGHHIIGTSGQIQSSVLEKLFRPALTIKPSASSNYNEQLNNVKEDERMNNSSFQSSKFARWFPEEETNSAEDVSSGKPKDFLSLIVTGGKGPQVSKVSDEKINEQVPGAAPRVLTCVDLEQSILSEIHETVPNRQDPIQAWSVWEQKHDPPRTQVDDGASQHLLSLLQKGINEENTETIQNSQNNLTLESLFGTNFMKELHSAEAPLSVQRGSFGGSPRADVLEAQDVIYPVRTDGFFPPIFDENESNKTTLEDGIPEAQYGKPAKPWLGFDAPRPEVVSKLTEDRSEEIQLPEEEHLIAIGDHVKPSNSSFISHGHEFVSSPEPSANIVDKLAELNAVLKSERSIGSGSNGQNFLGSLEANIPFQNTHGRASSQFRNPQMNHEMHLLQPLDPYRTQMSSRTPIMGQERIIHHDQLPGNAFLPPSYPHSHGTSRFEPPMHHHPMLQHMQMRDNFLPPHLLQGFPRGASPPPHHINHMAGFRPEMNPMHGFPSNHRQPIHSGSGMPMSAHGGSGGGGSSYPDSLERLIAMEMRANAKQMHNAASHNPGTYSHESDMGFRYR
ncbi:hypothetical protein GIB67_008301 [Kingdonia uniflora]|uniref:Uncharacterized protein n=1 Tax=Kingdonia uniflora TaxID=39325 RepID=A0A7J7N557_9MAGN|nr:hypothetical protein GIB67_008301 [Kingdonia uniflora]